MNSDGTPKKQVNLTYFTGQNSHNHPKVVVSNHVQAAYVEWWTDVNSSQV